MPAKKVLQDGVETELNGNDSPYLRTYTVPSLLSVVTVEKTFHDNNIMPASWEKINGFPDSFISTFGYFLLLDDYDKSINFSL